MAELKLRLNLDAEEVELLVDGAVALTSGKDVFVNWVEAYNEKHKPEPVPAPEPVVEAPEPVEEKAVENEEVTEVEESTDTEEVNEDKG